MAKLNRLPHPVAAQVEVAIAQPGLLADLAREGLDLEGRRVGIGEEVGTGHPDLDLAGREVRVDGLRRALDDCAARAEHVLRAELMSELESLTKLVRVEYELHESRPVAQVDEDEAAVVAAAMDPAGDAHLGIDPVGQDLAAPGVAVFVGAQRWESLAHGAESVSATVAGSISRSSPELMSRRVAFPSPPRMRAWRAPTRSACFICPLTALPARSRSAARPARRSSVTRVRACSRAASSATMKTSELRSSDVAPSSWASRARAIRSTPSAQPQPGVAGPPSCSISPS